MHSPAGERFSALQEFLPNGEQTHFNRTLINRLQDNEVVVHILCENISFP